MSDIIFYDTAIMQGAIDAAKIHTRSAYKSYLSSYTQENDQGLQGWAGLEMMFNFLPVLEKELAKHKGLKIHVSLHVGL